ncbi:hypothetical protein RAC89_01845 [Paenibacillus sp. GD4]|jgi:predicted 2-oxoglutarate/Fe(II)-dependent dioxygenase YbiX|uniref:hypothetical protein n=1 Tax=Paenibacillus TaxID=44249 RepID=UPI0025432368|nr:MULTISPECIES: hypothetical protein [Paenibacillus]MDQ1909241.1 hypothetical protein [Paenibacillus sp. GD4]
MDFTSQDIAVIEQALQLAMKVQGNESKAHQFREVLAKLQANATSALTASVGHEDSAREDGFRYDYDDSSDLL